MEISKALHRQILKAAKIAEPIFQANNWKWGMYVHTSPTKQELIDSLTEFVSQIGVNEASKIESGRFIILRNGLDVQICLELE